MSARKRTSGFWTCSRSNKKPDGWGRLFLFPNLMGILVLQILHSSLSLFMQTTAQRASFLLNLDASAMYHSHTRAVSEKRSAWWEGLMILRSGCLVRIPGKENNPLLELHGRFYPSVPKIIEFMFFLMLNSVRSSVLRRSCGKDVCLFPANGVVRPIRMSLLWNWQLELESANHSL